MEATHLYNNDHLYNKMCIKAQKLFCNIILLLIFLDFQTLFNAKCGMNKYAAQRSTSCERVYEHCTCVRRLSTV